MKKFSKADIDRIGRLSADLTGAWGDIDNAKTAVYEALARMNEAVAAYNEILGEARGFIEDQASIANDYMSERSEKWLEGDAGSAYQEWVSNLENVDLEDIEEIADLDLELPDEPDHASALTELPTEPEQF